MYKDLPSINSENAPFSCIHAAQHTNAKAKWDMVFKMTRGVKVSIRTFRFQKIIEVFWVTSTYSRTGGTSTMKASNVNLKCKTLFSENVLDISHGMELRTCSNF